MKLCSIENCSKKYKAKGLCSTHWQQLWLQNPENRKRTNELQLLRYHKNKKDDNYREKINSRMRKRSKKISKTPKYHMKKNEYLKRFFSNPENKRRYNKYQSEYTKKKRAKDPIFRLNSSISSKISKSLHYNKNGRHWENLVNFTLQNLKIHLENQFDEKMNWNNYGSYWYVDHIIPLSYYKLQMLQQDEYFKIVWALQNLRPLEARENLRKHNHLILESIK